ncbi:hypothetical protein EOD41_05735 [Mucilaginibacter limnophilus]|uniref:Uncharacterized protein n=1 Tax=Mucilaginibacter limnophilus TaxID=1932778 RepID=A0A437MUX5_9SPHI|nr:DUF6252 family protein [Mucilaginibacter limnophilus]RVU01464.1 hypothetical protein EOD41_05735 [Mucilaginibacter limnophilus]
MKKSIVLIAFAALVITGCKKEGKMCCDMPEQNYITAKVADTTWAAPLQATYYRDSLNLWAQHDEEHLFFRLKFDGTGKYLLNATEGTFFRTVGLDVITSRFITTDGAGEINITSYNKAKNVIEGNFSVQMMMTYPADVIPDPLKMYMKQGKFSVRLP